MSISTGATDMIGGTGYGGFGGGIGGVGLVGLIGLNSFLGRNGIDGNGAGIAGTTVLEQNVSDLRKDVADNGKEIHVLGNEVAGMFATQNLAFSGEFRNLDNQICNAEKAAMTAAFESRLAALQSTNEIKSDISLLSVKTDAQTTAILQAINADGDATRALITTNQINDLRDQLAAERRGRDRDGIEISINNSNAQAQAQIQTQRFENERRFDALFNQVAKASQDIINVGGILTGVSQTANPVNVK